MKFIAALLVTTIVVVAYTSRTVLARTNPCSVVYYSFDDGPFTFSHTYRSGRVGPFTVGQSKEKAISALSSHGLPFILPMELTDEQLEQFYFSHNSVVSASMRPILEAADEWRIAVRSCGNAHAIYTPSFVDGTVETVRLSYSALAGL